MNRRQLLKTLAVLPVTPVEKLLDPDRVFVIRGGSRRPAYHVDPLTRMVLESQANGDVGVVCAKSDIFKAIQEIERLYAERPSFADWVASLKQEPKPPCTPS